MSINEKSIDQLLIENPNLAHGVGLLILGCQDRDRGYQMLAEWDKIRGVKFEKKREINERTTSYD
jgi:hypothetical protein